MKPFVVVTLLLLLAFGSVAWAQPDAYARHWPVQVDETGMYAVTLTPELYAQIERPDLSDLAAFNGAGEALGFELLASIWTQPEPQWRDVPAFDLPPKGSRPGETQTPDETLSFEVDRSKEGRLSLRAEIVPSGPAASGSDQIIDTGLDVDSKERLQALAFELAPEAQDLSASVRIEGSHDLESWRTLVARGSLLQLRQDDRLLQRRRIPLNGATERYLRLHRLDSDAPLPIRALKVQTRTAATLAPQPIERLAAELIAAEDRAYTYRLPARIPVEQIHLRLPQDNVAVVAAVSSRERERDPWRSRGNLTAFRLRAAGVELDNEPLHLSGVRDRQWRVTIDGDLAQPPVLEFAYRPQRWLLLTQGPAPYVIAAGSTRAKRHKMPVAALLTTIRGEYGEDWQPDEVTLGEPIVAAGDAAIEASLQERWSHRVLWLLLIGSALAIAMMVLKLLRERGDEASP